MQKHCALPVYLIADNVAAATVAENLERTRAATLIGRLFKLDLETEAPDHVEASVKVNHGELARRLLAAIADNASPLVVAAALKAVQAPHDGAGFNAIIDKALMGAVSEGAQPVQDAAE